MRTFEANNEELHITIPRDKLASLREEAQGQGIPLSKIICQCVEEHIRPAEPQTPTGELLYLRQEVRDKRDVGQFLREMTQIYRSLRELGNRLDGLYARKDDLDSIPKLRFDVDALEIKVRNLERKGG